MARIAKLVAALLVLLVPALALIPRPAAAAAVVVGPGGFATIQQAVNNARPGDVITIAAGAYNETVDLTLMGSAVGGTAGDLALVAAGGPGSVTLGGSGAKLAAPGGFPGTLQLDGLTFGSTTAGAIVLGNVGNLLIANSTFRTVGNDAGADAIELALSSGAPNIVVLNSTFQLGQGRSGPLGAMVYLTATATAAPTLLVQDNTSTESGARPGGPSAARLLLGLGGAGASVTVRGNSFAASPAGGTLASFSGAAVNSLTIAGNTFNGAQDSLIAVSQGASALDATIDGNRTNGGRSGIVLNAGAQLTGRITNNRIDAPSERGINVQSLGTTATPRNRLALTGNAVNFSTRSGIAVATSGAGSLDVTVSNNSLLGPNSSEAAAEAGVLASAGGSSPLRMLLAGNDIDVVGNSNGVVLAEAAGSTFELGGDTAQSAQQNVENQNSTGGSTVVAPAAIGVVAPATVQLPPVDNGVPTAAADTASATSGSPATIDVLANDNAPNPPLALRWVAPIGRRGGAASGNVTYTSLPGFVGSDTLYYVAADARGAAVAGQVTVDVTAVPPPTSTPTGTPPPPPNPPVTPPTAVPPTPPQQPTRVPPRTVYQRFLPAVGTR